MKRINFGLMKWLLFIPPVFLFVYFSFLVLFTSATSKTPIGDIQYLGNVPSRNIFDLTTSVFTPLCLLFYTVIAAYTMVKLAGDGTMENLKRLFVFVALLFVAVASTFLISFITSLILFY